MFMNYLRLDYENAAGQSTYIISLDFIILETDPRQIVDR